MFLFEIAFLQLLMHSFCLVSQYLFHNLYYVFPFFLWFFVRYFYQCLQKFVILPLLGIAAVIGRICTSSKNTQKTKKKRTLQNVRLVLRTFLKDKWIVVCSSSTIFSCFISFFFFCVVLFLLLSNFVWLSYLCAWCGSLGRATVMLIANLKLLLIAL